MNLQTSAEAEKERRTRSKLDPHREAIFNLRRKHWTYGDVMTNLDAVCLFCGSQVDYVIVRNPARAAKTRMFDGSELERELLDLHAATIKLPVLSEYVKLRLAKLEADHQRGVPFNEAIGNDSLGLDIMARGVLQDWLGTLFAQYDQIVAKLLPALEAAGIKPRNAPPIGEPAAAKRGAKVNLVA